MRTVHSRLQRFSLPMVVAIVGVFGVAHIAAAALLEIPAVSFVLRCSAANCPGTGTDAVGEESQGLLLNAKGQYFAPVGIPTPGLHVCRFVLWYRDNDSDIDLTAHLKRKRSRVGDNAFTPPEVMATVNSTGANETLRGVATTTIQHSLVQPGRFFYFVEVEVPGNTLEVLGVKIDYRETCP